MCSPWLSIPLEDYEGHMDSAAVQQLAPLSELFRSVLERRLPPSVAILGVAGGNGLKQIDTSVTRRIVGVDVNQDYLEEVKRRFTALPGLELHCSDLNDPEFNLPPVLLVHAALIFEHVGLGAALDNALSLVAPGGSFSVVLQLPGEQERAVAPTGYTSMQALTDHFQFIDTHEFQLLLDQRGFGIVEQTNRLIPGGKALWSGLFSRSGR